MKNELEFELKLSPMINIHTAEIALNIVNLYLNHNKDRTIDLFNNDDGSRSYRFVYKELKK